MGKTIHFVSGMPRAGSTLLLNVLAQNPKFHVTATSGVLEILFQSRNQWDKVIEFKAAEPKENEIQRNNVLKGIFNGYFEHVERTIIFDKSRGWVAFAEMAEKLLGRRPKILVPVRDLRDILASFEKLHRVNSANRQSPVEAEAYVQAQTAIGRCQTLLSNDKPVGIALNRIKDAITRGFEDCMHFVEYERLCRNPKKVMQEAYDFLDEPYFEHDFENVEQVTQENDEWHGWGPNLHTIRHKVEPQDEQWPKVFDKTVTKNPWWKGENGILENNRFWENRG